MKKEITVCDDCKDEDLSVIGKCAWCHKDLCDDCVFKLDDDYPLGEFVMGLYFNKKKLYFCERCFDKIVKIVDSKGFMSEMIDEKMIKEKVSKLLMLENFKGK